MEEKNKVKFYQDKWVLISGIAIIISIILVIMALYILSGRKNRETSVNAVNEDNNTENYFSNLKKEYYDNEKINENPYGITKDFDGIYKFALQKYNGKTAVGVIAFKNGDCKIKYYESIDAQYNREYEGFCGINKEDNSTFYFTLNDDVNYTVKTYQSVLNGKNLSCKLKSKYDITGNSNSELTLIYLGESYDLDTSLEQAVNEEKNRIKEEEKLKQEQEKQAFLSSCQTYTFEQLARNPESVRGTNVKLTGEVVQVMEGTYSNSLRVNITKKGTYSTYYTDTIYVSYTPKAGEDKILEDDIITIYGTAQGDYSYTSTMGANITLPYVNAKYIVLQK